MGRGKGKAEWAETGDGYKREPIVREDGTIQLSPARPTLTWLGKNDEVYPDIRTLILSMQGDQMMNLPKIINNNQNHSDPELRRLMQKQTGILKEISNKSRISIHNHSDIRTTAWYIKNFKS
jgi:hypothetical protein